MINRKTFYDKIKSNGLFASIKQSQVDGINEILNAWEVVTQFTDKRWLAYMLATSYHETAKTMQPIEEYGKGKGRPYGSKVKHSGIKYTTPNKIYYGRGHVQLTWFENYELMGRLLCIDLLNKPELALQSSVAVKVMFEGMTRGSSSIGDFTGRCLEQYFNKTTNDPVGARKIINGRDKATLIAGYHSKFLEAIG